MGSVICLNVPCVAFSCAPKLYVLSVSELCPGERDLAMWKVELVSILLHSVEAPLSLRPYQCLTRVSVLDSNWKVRRGSSVGAVGHGELPGLIEKWF